MNCRHVGWGCEGFRDAPCGGSCRQGCTTQPALQVAAILGQGRSLGLAEHPPHSLHEGVEVDPAHGQLLDVVVRRILSGVPDEPELPQVLGALCTAAPY